MDMTPITRDHRWLNEDLGVYNAWDVEATVATEAPLRAALEESGNAEFFQRWFGRFVPVVMAMQRRGFGHLDRDALRTYRAHLRAQVAECETECRAQTTLFEHLHYEATRDLWDYEQASIEKYTEMCMDAYRWAAEPVKRRRDPSARLAKAEDWLERRVAAFELKSHRTWRDHDIRVGKFFNMTNDLRDVVFGELGFRPAPVSTRLKRGARSLQQEAILYILEHARPRELAHADFLRNLMHRNKAQKILGSYLDFWTGPDDRVYPTIQCASAVTLRLAYGDPPIQQWPRSVRHLIRARPGYVFIGRDFSQIEARIFALESGDPVLLEAFAKYDAAVAAGGKKSPDAQFWDVHGMNARHMFGLSWEAWQALDPALRDLMRNEAKRFLYRLLYGGDPTQENIATFCPCHRCAADVPQTLAQTQRERIAAQTRWFEHHGAVTAWQAKTCRQVKGADNVFRSRFGYHRKFYTPWPRVRTQVVNYPMQHGAAQVINAAMERLHWDHAAPIVLQMHDELILEVPEAEATAWDDILQTEMERPVPEYGGAVFPTDGHIATTWAGVK